MGENVTVAETTLEHVGKFRVAGRECGGCTACCTLVPVEELRKPRFTQCQFEKTGHGCSIYAMRPRSCREWVCSWLISGPMPDAARPDRCHVVINPRVEPEPVRLTDNETGAVTEFDTLTCWVDPRFPDAYRRGPIAATLRQIATLREVVFVVRSSNEATRLVVTGLAAQRLGYDPAGWGEMEGLSLRDASWTPETMWEKEALGL